MHEISRILERIHQQPSTSNFGKYQLGEIRRQEARAARAAERRALKLAKQENFVKEVARAMKLATLRLRDEWLRSNMERMRRGDGGREIGIVPFLRIPPEIHLRIFGLLHVVDGVCLSLVKYDETFLPCIGFFGFSFPFLQPLQSGHESLLMPISRRFGFQSPSEK